MKNKILVLCLLFIIIFNLVGCNTITNDNDQIIHDKYAIIKKYDAYLYLVYDIDTHIVYTLEIGYYNVSVTPHQFYQDGMIYGAIYESGEIIPVPYNTKPLN